MMDEKECVILFDFLLFNRYILGARSDEVDKVVMIFQYFFGQDIEIL